MEMLPRIRQTGSVLHMILLSFIISFCFLPAEIQADSGGPVLSGLPDRGLCPQGGLPGHRRGRPVPRHAEALNQLRWRVCISLLLPLILKR